MTVIYRQGQGQDISRVEILPYARHCAVFQYPDGLDSAVLTIMNHITLSRWYNCLYTDIYIYDWKLDTKKNTLYIYFITSGTPAHIVIYAILAILGTVIAGIITITMLKEIRLITIGTPQNPSPIRTGTNFALIAVSILIIFLIVKTIGSGK
jgi:hypothetical protein